MEKRDYLMDQIELLGQALASIFSKLYGLSSQQKIPEAIEMTSQSLKSELDLDLAELSSIPTDQFIQTLQINKKFNHANLEQLADILLLIADDLYSSKPGSDQDLNFYTRSLHIYNYLNNSDLTYSSERQLKIKKIESILF